MDVANDVHAIFGHILRHDHSCSQTSPADDEEKRALSVVSTRASLLLVHQPGAHCWHTNENVRPKLPALMVTSPRCAVSSLSAAIMLTTPRTLNEHCVCMLSARKHEPSVRPRPSPSYTRLTFPI